MKISEIKNMFDLADISQLKDIILEYAADERPGVCKLVLQAQNRIKKYEAEVARIEAVRQYEEKYSQFDYIGGIDEVGRGPLAGPVVTCALILPKGLRILYEKNVIRYSAIKQNYIRKLFRSN